MKVEGIVISISKYKDYNAMLTLLTKDNILSFQAYGVFKPFSKNFLLVNPLMYANFVFSDNKKYLSFKEANPIIDSRNFVGCPSPAYCIHTLNEMILKIVIDEDKPKLYPYLVSCLKCLYRMMSFHGYKIYTYILIFFAQCIKSSGYGLDVDECVITKSKKDIVGVSLIDGGLVSKSVFDPTKHIQYTADKIKMLRLAFKIKPEEIKDYVFDPKLAVSIIKDLAIYIKDQTNTDIKHLEMIDLLL